MRRILMLLTNAFDPDPRVYQEARALVEYDYEVTVLCWDRDYKKPEKEIVDGINVERIFIKSTHGRGATQLVFLSLFWLKAYLRVCFKKFHYVHCHDFDPTNSNAKYSAPNKLFEALAAGKPIVTGDFGEIGRIVRENKCRIVLNNYSSKEIKKTIEDLDADTLSYYNLNAKAAASLYNWHNAQSILLHSYNNLMVS